MRRTEFVTRKTFKAGALILSILMVSLATSVSAQLATGTIGMNAGVAQYLTISARGGLRLPNLENVEGSPFLDNQFHSARVVTKSGFDTTGVLVKFNVYGNEMVYLENGGIELALDSVDMVSYANVENGLITQFVFKTGYPNIDGLNKNTLYRVLAAGDKVQLLKYYSKKLEDVKSMGEFNKKEFVTREQLYIYSPAGGIKKVKLDKKSLQEALPEFSQQVETLLADKKMKKESDLVSLIAEINKP